jgi:hypothetical protein
LLLGVLGGCGLRDDWVHPLYAAHSDKHYADRNVCMHEAYVGRAPFGDQYSRERFSVCMQARGWRNP